MFKDPFSFKGRIRRSEYGISLIIYFLTVVIVQVIGTGLIGSSSSGYSTSDNNGAGPLIIFILYIPLLWFLLAQGAKRCHDVGNSGWFQLIPLYFLWLLLQDGDVGINKYGSSPKAIYSGHTPSSQPSSKTSEEEYR